MRWEMVNLGSVVENLDNRRIPLNRSERKEKEGEGKYPYFGANNIVGWIDEYIFDGKILCVAEDGGNWGKSKTCAFVYEGKCWVNNHAHVLSESGSCDINYLKYYLNHADLNKFITGTTRGKLTKTALNKIQIPLPSLPIQRQIAELLDTATALRQRTEDQLAELDQLAESVFLELFGDPVRNEKGWDVVKLGEVVDNHDSGRKPVKAADRAEMQGKFPYYGATGIIDSVNNYLFDGDYLLIAEDGKALVSRNKPIAFQAKGQFWVNNHAHVVKGRGSIEHTYLEYFFDKISIRQFVTGIDQYKLNRRSLDRIPVHIPPRHLQAHFVRIIENLEAQKKVLRCSLRESEDLVSCLLQEIFAG